MPDEPVPDDAAGLRAANARLRAVVAERAAEIEGLRAGLEAERELRRRLELRLAELERRLGMDSTDSGTPSSKERIGAKEARKARQQSERERSKDRKRGGQPGHQGKGLTRDPDPDDSQTADPPAECRSCRTSLDGAEAVEPRWAQVIDIEILRKVTEYLLPGLACGGCGAVTFAEPPPGLHAGAVCYGPVLNAAAVLLSCCGNVPAERSAQLIGMLLGTEVSAGWVDKAVARVTADEGGPGPAQRQPRRSRVSGQAPGEVADEVLIAAVGRAGAEHEPAARAAGQLPRAAGAIRGDRHQPRGRPAGRNHDLAAVPDDVIAAQRRRLAGTQPGPDAEHDQRQRRGACRRVALGRRQSG